MLGAREGYLDYGAGGIKALIDEESSLRMKQKAGRLQREYREYRTIRQRRSKEKRHKSKEQSERRLYLCGARAFLSRKVDRRCRARIAFRE